MDEEKRLRRLNHKKVAKLLRHLKRNCDTAKPEAVKLFVANKTSSNGHKENLMKAYDLYMQSLGLKWDKPFYQRYYKKRKAPNGKLVDFLINHARIGMKLADHPVIAKLLSLESINAG
jgi:hypothetical protein